MNYCLCLLLKGPASERIDSIQGWEAKRDRILDVMKAILGEPSNLSVLPPKAEILGEEDMGTYIRRHLRVRSEPDDWIPAYMLIPKNLPKRPMPHDAGNASNRRAGQRRACGIKGNPELAFAVELVERGYICFAPDVIGFGERIPKDADPYTGAHDFYRKHPNWSFFGKMVWDIQRVIDYLESLPEVDPYRIGSIGHSHGSYGTIMNTIFEPRISAAVASCGFTTLRTDPDPNRWSHLTALMPRVGFYVDDVKQTPFDWHEIAACIAPRPYFNWATLNDDIFPGTDNLKPFFEEIGEVYALYGATDNLEPNLVPGKHSFPKEGREKAYQWLDKKLAPRIVLEETREQLPKSKLEWNQTREAIKKLLLRDLVAVDPPQLPAEYEVISEVKQKGYVEQKIRYRVDEQEKINAYLLIPEKKQEKTPAVVVYHQTTEEGKEEAVGHSGRESLYFGPELTQRGYIVLAPDSIAAGERITKSGAFDTRDFYRTHPNTSALGRMIQDGRRAIDILQAVPGVDAERIGTIGHSLGAENSLFVAAFDERVKAAAASCGYAPFRDEKNPWRWARDRWFSYMPRLRIDLRAGRAPAWDFDDVIRLIAPRGYFNIQTSDDEIFRKRLPRTSLRLRRGLSGN